MKRWMRKGWLFDEKKICIDGWNHSSIGSPVRWMLIQSRAVRSSMNPDKKVRRLQGLLYTSGVGTILISIWSGIRGIESLFEICNELSQEYGTEPGNTVISIILCLFIFLILM